ncbi:thiol reductant ABC exporter subunit CydC [Vagococcus entomophilus]|uniref:thiol reductant ABC exporter subunit CydC n=1 Tax=Vagococcus entomophilus TaxID=1160095 RepID=UPI000F86ED2A|nr:thiol reductant ABC exporter subunit CydC [Vagococcus entomophilus]
MKTSKYLLLSRKDTWVRPYFKKYKKLLLLVLFLGMMTFFCGSALMFNSGYLISKSATHPVNILLVYVPIVLTRAFGIGRPAFRYVERLASHNWVLKMTSDIRLKLYRSLESKAMQARGTFQSGDVLGILAEDIEHIQNLYLRTIFPTLIAWLLYGIIVVIFGAFSLVFAGIMLLLIGVLVIVFPLVSVLMNQAKIYRRKEKRHELYGKLTDSILGVGDWQYSGRYEEFLDHYNQAEKEVRAQDEPLNQATRRLNTCIQFIFGGVVIALFIWAGMYYYQTGHAGLNWIAAFVLAFFPLMDAFAPIATAVTEMPMYEDSAKRLDALPKPKSTSGENERNFCLKDTTIQLENVSFQYGAQAKWLLQNFNWTIESGKTTAVLGKSGTGKTTLSQLIHGDLSPTTGRVLIGGTSVEKLDTNIHQLIGVLSQSPHLFDTTIINNVRLGNIKASDEEVYEAIVRSGLQELVERLPDGVHTMVEEGGKRFSGGEQQRIALARILLQDVPIVIIDEPTIGLDPITERKLLQTVFEVLKEKTVIWITHHLVGIEAADEVLFLENGNIEMHGAPKELKKTNKRFQQLYFLDQAE